MGVGLWRQANWARVAVIVLAGLAVLLNAVRLLLSLPYLFSGRSDPFTWVISILTMVFQAYLLNWFVTNREYFK